MIVKTWDEALDAIDGRRYKLDGVWGEFRLEIDARGYCRRVTHEATREGKASETYRETRRKLGDDWVSDLTWSERLPAIMDELGIKFEGDHGS
jgi:hypothetical protein